MEVDHKIPNLPYNAIYFFLQCSIQRHHPARDFLQQGNTLICDLAQYARSITGIGDSITSIEEETPLNGGNQLFDD